MRSISEVSELHAALTDARISLTSPRAHRATSLFKDGESMQSVVKTAVAHEASARQLWIQTALDPWCERHGLTRTQGLSVAFQDSPFDPKNPSKDRVTLKSLFGWSGQQNDFAVEIIRQEQQKQTDDKLFSLPFTISGDTPSCQ